MVEYEICMALHAYRSARKLAVSGLSGALLHDLCIGSCRVWVHGGMFGEFVLGFGPGFVRARI